MEPITTICYLLTYSVGYFIGADLYNYYKAQEGLRDLRNDLHDLNSVLHLFTFQTPNIIK